MNRTYRTTLLALLVAAACPIAIAQSDEGKGKAEWLIAATTPTSTVTINPATGRQMTSNKLPLDGAVSPDGKRIARCKTIPVGHSSTTELFIGTINDGGKITGERQVTNGAANAMQPQWMPDGKRVVYVRGEGKFQQVYCASVDDEKWSERRVSAGGVRSHMPRIASDGRVAYLAEVGKDGKATTYDFMIMAPGNNKPVALVENAAITEYAWSPDTNTIAYSTHGELVIINVATKTPDVRQFKSIDERLGPHHATSLAWRPDGQALAAIIRFSGGVSTGFDGKRPPPAFPETAVFLIPREGGAKSFTLSTPAQDVTWIKAM